MLLRQTPLTLKRVAPCQRPRARHASSGQKPKNPHAQWYADVVPAMVPVALLGSAVYLFLQLAQLNLSHEKHLDQARTRVSELEADIATLRLNAASPRQPDHQSPSSGPTAKPSGARWWPFS